MASFRENYPILRVNETTYSIECLARTCKSHPTDGDLFAFGGRTGAVEIYSVSTLHFRQGLKNSADVNAANVPANNPGIFNPGISPDEKDQTERAMIVGLCFSNDGNKFFVANRNGYTRIYDLPCNNVNDVPRPKLLRLHDYKSKGEFLTVLLKGNKLLTSYKKGNVALHSFHGSTVTSLTEPMTIEAGGGVKALSFIPPSWPFCTNNHTILLVSEDGTCYFRDDDSIPNCKHEACFRTGVIPEEIKIPTCIFESEITSITPSSFAMTGQGFVMNFNMTAYFNNPEGFNLEDHSSVFSLPEVKFGKCVHTRSGMLLYVAADDGKVYLFNLRNGTLQLDGTIQLHTEALVDIDLTCNDSHIIVVSEGGTVVVNILGTPTFGSKGAGAYEINYNIPSLTIPV